MSRSSVASSLSAVQLNEPLDFSTVAALAERSSARRATHRHSSSVGGTVVGGASYSKALTGDRVGGGSGERLTSARPSISLQTAPASNKSDSLQGASLPPLVFSQTHSSAARDGVPRPRSTAPGLEGKPRSLVTPPITPANSQNLLLDRTSSLSGTTVGPVVTITLTDDAPGTEAAGSKQDKTRRRRHRRTGKNGSGSHQLGHTRKGSHPETPMDNQILERTEIEDYMNADFSSLSRFQSPGRAGVAMKPRSVSMSATAPKVSQHGALQVHIPNAFAGRTSQLTPPPSPPTGGRHTHINSLGPQYRPTEGSMENPNWAWAPSSGVDGLEAQPRARIHPFPQNSGPMLHSGGLGRDEVAVIGNNQHHASRYYLGSDHGMFDTIDAGQEPERGRTTFYSPFATGVDFGFVGSARDVEAGKPFERRVSVDVFPVDIYGRDLVGSGLVETNGSRYPGDHGRRTPGLPPSFGSTARPKPHQTYIPMSPGRQNTAQTWNSSLLLDIPIASGLDASTAGGARSPHRRAESQQRLPTIETGMTSPVDDSYINNLLASPVAGAGAAPKFFDEVNRSRNDDMASLEMGSLSQHPLLLGETQSDQTARGWAGTLLQRVSGVNGTTRTGHSFETPLMGLRRSYDDPRGTERGYSLFG
ncbi:hypothetical protein HDU93_009037 [Gonapodya sp. JEL0774]|nr:hypothetical protein HDU93_009037 [Gonapodya sp. JEL0774]